MAKRIAVIPEEFLSSYKLQKPEIRLEDEIGSLLEKANLADDMKVKLLSQLIMRYHQSVHKAPDPIPVSVTNDVETVEKTKTKSSKVISDEEEDPTVKEIVYSTPHRYSKFVPLILEKLKSRQYGWNEFHEMTQNNKTIHNSNIVDFFVYLMRNVKSLAEPKHFHYFLKALKEIRIPHTWIANQKVLKRMKEGSVSYLKSDGDSPDEESGATFPTSTKNIRRRRSNSNAERYNERIYDERRSRSTTPDLKWLNY